MKQSNSAAKIFMAGLAIVTWMALILQFKLILDSKIKTGFSSLKLIINFFSYFTILSNLLVALCLTSVLVMPRSGMGNFFSRASVKSAIMVYIFIVGLVYNTVLRGIVTLSGLPWIVDNLLHVIVPVFYVVYWLIYSPKRVFKWTEILPWLIFPMLYLAYSLTRGPVAHWFPYPFLNTETLSYSKVAVNCLFVMFAFVLVSLAAVALNRRRAIQG